MLLLDNQSFANYAYFCSMSQLIIILLFLRNLFKPFRITFARILFSVIALTLSFYIYHVYNNIQQQNIYIVSRTIGNAKTNAEYLTLNFNYAESKDNQIDTVSSSLIDIRFLEYSNQPDNITYNGDSISKFTAITKYDDSLKNQVKNTDFISNLYVNFDFYDNSWLFSHPIDPLRKIPQYQVIDNCEIDSTLCYISYSNVDIDNNRPNWLGLYIGRKRRIMSMQSLYSSVSDIDSDSLQSGIGLIENLNNNIAIYEPHWYSAYDVSKFQLDVHFDVDTLNQFCITFGDLTDISELLPSPDKKLCMD